MGFFFSRFWSQDMNTTMLTPPLILQYIVNTSFGIEIVLKVVSILSHFVFKNEISKIDLLSSKNL